MKKVEAPPRDQLERDARNKARERKAIIAALRHCQGMGHRLPLTDTEIDALCKRLGDTQ